MIGSNRWQSDHFFDFLKIYRRSRLEQVLLDDSFIALNTTIAQTISESLHAMFRWNVKALKLKLFDKATSVLGRILEQVNTKNFPKLRSFSLSIRFCEKVSTECLDEIRNLQNLKVFWLEIQEAILEEKLINGIRGLSMSCADLNSLTLICRE
jgi:hypothetical protein